MGGRENGGAMIDPKELRIGNCVHYNDGDQMWEPLSDSFVKKPLIPVQIKSLNSSYEIALASFTYFENKDGYNITTGLGNIYPIPLTLEILTDWCGFKKSDYWDALYIGLQNQIWYKDGGFYFRITARRSKKVQYIHQLQNLVFAFEDKELEIKIPASV